MKSISLYEEKNSTLNHLDSGCKMLYMVAAILVPALIGNKWANVAVIILSVFLLAISKVLRKTVPVLSVSGIVILTIVIIQGMFRAGNTTVVLQLGPAAFYKEGLLYSLGIALNVFNILLAICVLIFTTKPSDMVENFIEKGFSPRLGYVFISIFQIIPQMMETMNTITDAQRSRGMETEGSLLVRIKAFLPLISPVVMSSLVDTKERAIALEVRGFNAKTKKTFLNERKVTTTDKIINLLLIAAVLASVAWRVKLWLG
ncbi:MAG: energy-coupling factor transporter transmembrane component T [Hespellia sp.]|nr:energy-coupling factor transporter transmembrane component T [Hespellia sp.]